MQQQKHPVNTAQQHPSQGVPAQNPPDDLFSDLQPKLKAAKTVGYVVYKKLSWI